MITNIAIHHTGGLGNDNRASTQHLTWQNVNSYHRTKWNSVSTLGYFGGYNFYVPADGKTIQFRAIGEETLAQKGYNFNTISICMAGNFLVDKPTEAQREAVTTLIKKILEKDFSKLSIIYGTVIDVKKENIKPHRFYQPGTQCDCLPSDWGIKLLNEVVIEKKNAPASILSLVDSIILLMQKLRSMLEFQKLGASDKSCDGYIITY